MAWLLRPCISGRIWAPSKLLAVLVVLLRCFSSATHEELLDEATLLAVREHFSRDGYAVVRNFASQQECDAMMARMDELIDAWDPYESHWRGDGEDNATRTSKPSVFRTDGAQESAQGSDDYFLTSSDKVHFFLEPSAVDETTGELNRSLRKHAGLNKVGHGLHQVQGRGGGDEEPLDAFQQYTYSLKVGQLARRALGMEAPVVPQSMFIFKQPRIGGEVTSHQDSAFLFTAPRQTCVGLWLALEDASEENGCLWARPGAHGEPVRRHFARNPAYFGAGEPIEGSGEPQRGGVPTEQGRLELNQSAAASPARPPMMVFRDLVAPTEASRRRQPSESVLVDAGGVAAATNTDPDPPGVRALEGLSANSEALATEGTGACGGAGATKTTAMERMECIVRSRGFRALEVSKGDLVAIHGQLDHLSLPNTSPSSRRTFQLHLIEGPSTGVVWSPLNWLQTPGKPFPDLAAGAAASAN